MKTGYQLNQEELEDTSAANSRYQHTIFFESALLPPFILGLQHSRCRSFMSLHTPFFQNCDAVELSFPGQRELQCVPPSAVMGPSCRRLVTHHSHCYTDFYCVTWPFRTEGVEDREKFQTKALLPRYHRGTSKLSHLFLF